MTAVTINWADGWFTTTVNPQEAVTTIKQDYPEAFFLPLGVQKLVWKDFSTYIMDDERKNVVASII